MSTPGTGDAPGLDVGRFNRLLLESAGVGLALAHADTLEVTYCNPRFGQWFPDAPAGGGRLDAIVPGIDATRLAARLEEGRPYQVEAQIKVRHRTMNLAVQVARHAPEDGVPLLVVECQNISKIKELEYMVESYSKMVEKHNRELRKEKERVERLLLNIMPRTVYEEWKTFGVTTPQRFERAGVLMLDFAGFTDMAVSRDPTALIGELNDIFTSFDRIVDQFGCERIKTIGDAYMAVAGIPEPGPDDARSIANVALRMLRYLQRRNESSAESWRARIGLHVGPVIGSIVGIQKYVYDIFGPGVNLAARMETLARPMSIVVSEAMHAELRADFEFRDLGETEIKGFGTQRVYELEGSDLVRLDADLRMAAVFD